MYKVLVLCVFVACLGCAKEPKKPEPFAGCTEDEARETAQRVLDFWYAAGIRGDWREEARRTRPSIYVTLPRVRVQKLVDQPYPGRPHVFLRTGYTDLVSYEKDGLLRYEILAGEEYTKTRKTPPFGPAIDKYLGLSTAKSTGKDDTYERKYRRFAIHLVFENDRDINDAKILVRRSGGSWDVLFEFPNQDSLFD
jgi:hypothetical protein